MKCIFAVVLFTCTLRVITAVTYELNDDEYYKMPPIVSLEPYDRCLRRPGAVYCSAYFVYVADQYSPLLHRMKEYSEQNRTHFNHTRALLGVCVTSSCKHLLNNISDLGSTLEACLNETVHEKYKLKVRLDNELFCISKDGSINNNKVEIDTVDISVGIVALAFVVLNIVGSYIDVNCSEESKNGVVSQILLCFSISRNWKWLKSPFNEIQDPRIERLKGIHGIRVISTSLVILAHSLLPALVLGENPQFLEEAYSIPLSHVFLNGTLIMQTFLIMSSFLLVYNLQILAEKKTITWKLLTVVFVKRLFRLTPPFAFILALTATWIRHIGTGPLWQKAVIQESNDCRRDWWLKLLYVNNYVDGSHCMPHTWYLATDTQLFALGLVVYLLGRDLRIRKKLLAGLFLVGLVLPGLHTYFQDLEGNLLITLAVAMNFFVTDPTYNKVYRRGHTNLSGYVVGLSLGYLVYHVQNVGFDASNYKRWRPVFWCLVPLGFAIVMSNKVFYDGPRLGVMYRVIGAVLKKPLFAVCIAAIMLGFFVRLESIYRGVVEWGGWQPLSRVSYSTFLLHIIFIKTWTGLHTETFYVSYLRLIEVVSWMLVLTWLSGILFWLTVEAPLGNVTKLLLKVPASGSNLEPCKPDEKKDL